jgi:hypothetical protein
MKCDACITGEARHRRRARVSLDPGVIESTLDLCEICYAVANNLQDAVMRIDRHEHRIREGDSSKTLQPSPS